jgi:XTP/dITP diphosphohydrolase
MNLDPSVIVLATRNANKIKEITAIFADTGIKFKTAEEFGCADVIEDGETLEDNARKKAYEVALATQHIAMADDSGLEVDFLDGAPGVISARFAGTKCSYADNNTKLIKLLRGVPPQYRKARFRSVIALAVPGGATQTVEGRIDGMIAEQARGDEGFGYDPVFLVPDYGKTLAEMGQNLKNTMSHRYKALQAIRPVLLNLQRSIQSHLAHGKRPPFEII